MTIDLTFDGTTECRGRNGWFQLRQGLISVYQPEHEIWISLYSKTHGENAPIKLYITNPDELRTLICGLAKALAQMTTKEDA